jgi:hypothetical protein
VSLAKGRLFHSVHSSRRGEAHSIRRLEENGY